MVMGHTSDGSLPSLTALDIGPYDSGGSFNADRALIWS